MSRVTAVRIPLWQGYAVPHRLRTRAPLVVLALACVSLWACSLPDDTPTEPAPVQSVTPATPAPPAPTADPNNPTPPPVLAGPAPKATPTPAPTAEPTPGPTPDSGGSGEGAAACGDPLPPPLSRINVKVHLKGATAWTLDSTPIVGPDPVYCAKVGFPDRTYCPVRPEGNPQRSACELYVIGRAADTGRPGPTWYHGNMLCTGGASGCANHSENQYLLLVYTGGNYRACGQNGVCGDEDVDK